MRAAGVDLVVAHEQDPARSQLGEPFDAQHQGVGLRFLAVHFHAVVAQHLVEVVVELQ